MLSSPGISGINVTSKNAKAQSNNIGFSISNNSNVRPMSSSYNPGRWNQDDSYGRRGHHHSMSGKNAYGSINAFVGEVLSFKEVTNIRMANMDLITH
jgi:hypothetical protein